ncbi:hypothetical protein [Pseudoalteromonas piscicida]|uniref:hypothetical protein n=1 Tax=Pseudoalteromonas piscicida TaxID=43662 RepID=UPI0030A26A9C
MKNWIIGTLSYCIFLSTALADASMRIEVEVYNGPLSKSIEVQKAELIGTVNITAHVLANLTRAIHVSECRLGCFGSKKKKSQTKKAGEGSQGEAGEGSQGEAGEGSQGKAEEGSQGKAEEGGSYLLSQCSSEVNSNLTLLDQSLSEIKEHLNHVDMNIVFPKQIKRLYPEIFPIKDYTTLSLGKESWRQEMVSIPTNNDDALHHVCPQLADVKFNVLNVLNYIAQSRVADCRAILLDDESGDGNLTPDSLTCLSQIANVGKLMTEGAEHWATTQVAILPNNKRTRIAIARTAVTVAELGNELIARADAIIKQEKGVDFAELLPTSVFLRDSEGTDYLNMFEWLDATPRTTKTWPIQSRTRMIERLINDNNWSKINTAFAQGDGKTSMVFVKDRIGNWNLKNYDNNPTEMLQAYKTIGTNLFTSAAKLATKVTTGSDVIQNLANVQQVTQQGENMLFAANDSHSDDVAEKMESRTKARINNTYNAYVERMAIAKNNIMQITEELESKEQALLSSANNIKDIISKQKEMENEVNQNEFTLQLAQQKLDKFLSKYPDGNIPSHDIKRAHSDLEAEVDSHEGRLARSKDALESYNTKHKDQLAKQDALANEVSRLKIKLENEKTTFDALPNEALLVIEEILDSHGANLKALQHSIAESDS